MHMQLGENAQMALTTLRENKMRSFLTVLGVVIGITALLSVVAILVGVYSDLNAFLSDFGPNTLFIFKFDPGIHTSGRLSREELARKPLTLEDAKAIGELCPAVQAVSAAVLPRADESGRGRIQTARYKAREAAGVDARTWRSSAQTWLKLYIRTKILSGSPFLSMGCRTKSSE